jgi:hypothetical protein
MEIKYRSFKRELGVDPEGLPPQIVVWEGEIRRWRSGYWAGRIFNGVDSLYCCSEKTQRKNKGNFTVRFFSFFFVFSYFLNLFEIPCFFCYSFFLDL